MPYKNSNGEVVPLDGKQWRKIRTAARNRFDGSDAAFYQRWLHYRVVVIPATKEPECFEDVVRVIHEINVVK